MNRKIKLPGILSSALALLVLGATVLQAQEHQLTPAQLGRLSGEIGDAIRAQGIPIVSIRSPDGRTFELEFKPECSGAQRAQAEAIKAQILADPHNPIVVDNLTDALVVLRFEPENASANALVRQRYDALRAAARDQ